MCAVNEGTVNDGNDDAGQLGYGVEGEIVVLGQQVRPQNEENCKKSVS